VVNRADLPDELTQPAGSGAPAATAAAPPVSTAAGTGPVPTVAGDDDDEDGALELPGDASLKEIVRAETSRVEREVIARALTETGGNVTQAAKLLKISRKSLQMKMKELGLRDSEPPA